MPSPARPCPGRPDDDDRGGALGPLGLQLAAWRFAYALRDTPAWETLFGLLVPFNQGWVKNAGALVFLASNGMMNTPDGLKPSYSASFDAGTASALFQLQAVKMGGTPTA